MKFFDRKIFHFRKPPIRFKIRFEKIEKLYLEFFYRI